MHRWTFQKKLHVHFTEPRHGIIRKIPYKYEVQPLPANSQKADRQLESGGYTTNNCQRYTCARMELTM